MTAAVLVTAVSGACIWAQTAPAPVVPTTSGSAIPAGGAMADPNAPIALINGRPINNKAFHDIMMQVAGMRVFQQVFDLSLVQGACLDADVPLEGAKFQERLDAELLKTMDGLNIAKTLENKTLTKDERLNVLGGILQQQGITAVEFRLGLETRANLRALSEGKVEAPTATEIKDAYESEYGEKRTVHIMTYNPAKDSPVTIKDALAKKKAEGSKTPPEDVAKDLSLPAPAIWVISANAKNIDVILNVAKTLKNSWDVSAETDVPGQNGVPQKVLIVLEKITPSRMNEVKQETVQKEYTDKVFDFKQSQWMNTRLASLRSRAAVDIKDPILSQQFQQVADQMARQAAANAAATQPGATIPAVPAATGTRPAAPLPRVP